MKKTFLAIIVLSALCYGKEDILRSTTFISDQTCSINELLERFVDLYGTAQIDLSNAPRLTITTNEFIARVIYYSNKIKITYEYHKGFNALRFHDKLVGFIK